MNNLFLKRLCKEDIRSLGIWSVIYCLMYAIDRIKKLPATTLKKMLRVSCCSAAGISHVGKWWASDVPWFIFSVAELPCPNSHFCFFVVLNLGVLNLQNLMVLNQCFSSWTAELLSFTSSTITLVRVLFLLFSCLVLGHLVLHTLRPWAEGNAASSEGSILAPH